MTPSGRTAPRTDRSPARRSSTDLRGAAAFTVTAFAISWASWGAILLVGGDYLSAAGIPLYVSGSFGPSLAVVALAIVGVVRRRHDGHSGTGSSTRWRRPPRSWRRRVRWVLLGALIGTVGTVGAAVAHRLGGGSAVDWEAGHAATYGYLGSPVVFWVVQLLLGPVSEEPGWRGHLYPRIRGAGGPGTAAVAFGPVWALWHLPLFLLAGTYQHQLGLFSAGGLTFLVATTALGVAISFALERGGLLAAISVHFVSNTLPVVAGQDWATAPRWDAAAKVVLAVVLMVLWRRRGPAVWPPDNHHAPTAPCGDEQDRLSETSDAPR